MAIEKTFGMIKPEGLQYADDIEARIIAANLEVEEQKEMTLTEEQFEIIYSHAKYSIPEVYAALKEYMTSNPVKILCVSGEMAREKLLQLRGCSNAADTQPGTIRGDYAADQDYQTLNSQGKFAKNIFHAADADDAEEMIDIFFGGIK